MGRGNKNKYAGEIRRAILADDVAQLRRLVADGGDLHPPDIINRTLLHTAAAKGSINAAMALLDMGLDIDARNRSGETPLFTALRQGKAEMAIALIRRGARMDISNVHGDNPFGGYDNSAQSRETVIRVLEKLSLENTRRLHKMAANRRPRKPSGPRP